MNRIYMTFLTKNDLLTYPWLREVEGSALARYVGGYIVTDGIVVDKVTASEKPNIFRAIRPVIKSNTSLIPFIEKHRTNKGDLDFKNISFGSYPLHYAKDLFRLSPNSCERTGKKRTLIQDGKIKTYDEYNYEGRRFVFISAGIIEIKPLTWEYNIKTNSLICKQVITDIPYNRNKNNNSVLLSYIYMNYYLFKELLEKYEVVNLTNSIRLVEEKDGVSFDYPYNNYIEMDDDGNVICHEVKSYKLTIPKGVKKIPQSASKSIADGEDYNLNLDIDIDGEGLKIETDSFNFKYKSINASINSLTVHNVTKDVEDGTFSFKSPINNITIPCDFTLFSRLYLSDGRTSKNLFENSNLTLTYNSEKELIHFVNDVNRFFSLIIKSNKKENKESQMFFLENSNRIDFTYKHNLYVFDNASKCIPSRKLLADKEILSILKVSYFTLKGPKISDELISKLFPNFAVKKEFTDLIQEEDTEKQIEESKKHKTTKEAEHILDLAREILSIDYIGLDKDSVKTKVKDIVDEYNNGLSKTTEGLSLTTNNGVYTNAVIKLENLRDTLYHNFEKNLDYYDILDLIENMIKKLNDKDVNLDYEILKDLDTLNNILKYSEDEQTKNEIITYLENERQSITDYLCGKKEIDYKNINEFVKKFRLFLVPILTRVSGNVSKVDVMEQIKDYALDEMNDKTTENTNNYIKLILSEIDKIKKNIVELDSEYTFEDLDYSSFKTGKEILDYLDKKYMEYYRVYLDLMKIKANEENYENSKVHLNI